MNPQEVRGLDVGLMWQLRGTRFGSFDVDVEMARLLKYYRTPSPGIQDLLNAQSSGQINAGVTITGGGNLLRQNGAPATKVSASLTWHYSQVTVGAFTKYISNMQDTNLLSADGTPWLVSSQVTGNLYGQYEFARGRLPGARIRLGVNNITNEPPPLASGAFGYIGSEYQPYARYWYGSVGIRF